LLLELSISTLSLSVTLAFLVGIFCIGASFLKLGAFADFLSKPILVGFLNGIALSIILGQIGQDLWSNKGSSFQSVRGTGSATHGVLCLKESAVKSPPSPQPCSACPLFAYVGFAINGRTLSPFPAEANKCTGT
jgi:hypothetical protein